MKYSEYLDRDNQGFGETIPVIHERRPSLREKLSDWAFGGFLLFCVFAILWFFVTGGFGGGR